MTTSISNPNFPVVTHAVWSEPTPAAVNNLIVTEILSLISQGKTDGYVDLPDTQAPFNAYRNWLDTDSANAWIAWLQANGGSTLVSAQIVV